MLVKVLLINPNKWGRGITSIWIASHAASLKSSNNEVKLFDSTFYKNWSDDEISYNTDNKQYKPTDYQNYVKFNENDIFDDLQKFVTKFEPDVIFWSALSSHIHGEGEYVNIQYGYELTKNLSTNALKIAAGLQPTANPFSIFEKFPNMDYFIAGESELVLTQICEKISNNQSLNSIPGLILKKNSDTVVNPPQPIISDMDQITNYDYSLFDDQIFFRPYNGKIVRAVDYELSRGCVYTCSYCVETTIQNYYGFTEATDTGILKNAKNYLRNKSAKQIFTELQTLSRDYGIILIRCQDTNFLTIDRDVLNELADQLNSNDLPIKLYIETRPEGITKSSVDLLKKLKVDGVGMGIEVSSEGFRKSNLNRFPSQEKIIEAFSLLKKSGIKRTAYNIIGLPNETEEMILDTIRFNHLLNPDNITVAFYSPYLGTNLQLESKKIGDFNDYEFDVDGQLRTVTKSKKIDSKLLEFYKQNFSILTKEGLDNLEELKNQYGIKS